MPSINVVIRVWNRAHVIGRAIDSVVGQDLPAQDWSIEVLVVDDASTDDLAGALRRFGPQVRCIRHERNAGAAAARNTGIRAAKCDYLAFLDSDDVWLPTKLARQLALMRSKACAANTSPSCRSICGAVLRPGWRWKKRRPAIGSTVGAGPHPAYSSRFGWCRSGTRRRVRSSRGGWRGVDQGASRATAIACQSLPSASER